MRAFAFVLLLLVGCGKDSTTTAPATQVIVHGPITIPAGQVYFATIDSEATRNNRFKAQIQVTQGGSLDIEVYVITDQEAINFNNGNQFRALYSSGRVTVASTDLQLLPPGRYHFIVSNRFSVVTNKTVQITATLE